MTTEGNKTALISSMNRALRAKTEEEFTKAMNLSKALRLMVTSLEYDACKAIVLAEKYVMRIIEE
jgi:hypothetical protein